MTSIIHTIIKTGGCRMIYYFSGTGNSEWIAKELAREIHMEAVNIAELNKNQKITVEKGETVGFICPVYAWKPAEIMLSFMQRVSLSQDTFSFVIITCGSEVGLSEKAVKKILPVNSYYSICMPNNYIIGSDVDPKDEIITKLTNAKNEIKRMKEEIEKKVPTSRMTKGSLSFVKSAIVANAFNKFARRTDQFFTDDTCVSCGLCEKVCPIHTIEMKEGRPVWKETCLQCLSCINHCPQKAIQYGDKTRSRGRYTIEEYLGELESL